LAFMGTGHSAQPCARQQLDAGLPTHVLYPHMRISGPRHDVVSISGLKISAEPRLGGAVHSQKSNADERPLNHRKYPSYKSNLSRFAMLSGLSEISLCTCRSFDPASIPRISDSSSFQAAFQVRR